MIESLMIYRKFHNKEKKILRTMWQLMETEQDKNSEMELTQCIHEIVENSYVGGFYGNLWHCCLTNLLVNHENAYSLSMELSKQEENELTPIALHDMRFFHRLFQYDFRSIADEMCEEAAEMLQHVDVVSAGSMYSAEIRDIICDLAATLGKSSSPEEMLRHLTGFYRTYGVGMLGLHKGFRLEVPKEKVRIRPVANVAGIHLNDLVGYEIQKNKLLHNTEAFLAGKRANNCLLFGDAGTGKSSSMKALANQYYDQGLRVIEVYKHQFQYLNELIGMIRCRNYKFIIYMDDLSFEDFEIEYKYLKAIIEGGLEEKPGNVLTYATSNRRHLIHERFSDKEGKRDFMHASDTVQEKLSLAARFGVTIFYGSPDPREFQTIVTTLAKRYGVVMEEAALLAEANQWELAHGGLSGRTAQQFIDYLLGRRSE